MVRRAIIVTKKKNIFKTQDFRRKLIVKTIAGILKITIMPYLMKIIPRNRYIYRRYMD